MRFAPSRLSWMLPVVALCYASSPASAQPGSGGSGGGGGGSTGAANAGSGRGDAQVGFQRRAQLSPAEQVTQGNALLGRMQAAASGIQHQLEVARGQRDVVKTLCLNDKLSQIDVATKSGSDRAASLSLAAQRNDAELSNHEFTILTVLSQRSQQLTAEANQCVGEDTTFGNQVSTTVTVDPSLGPGSDPNSSPPVDPIVAPPPAVSTPAGSASLQ